MNAEEQENQTQEVEEGAYTEGEAGQEGQEAAENQEQGVLNEDYIGEEDLSQNQPQEEDWRVQAIRNDPAMRERFDRALFGEQQQQQEAAPQVDPVQQAREELQEIEQNRPALDKGNMTADAVADFMQWTEQRNQAQQKVHDARVEQMQSQVMSQQARSQLEDYVQQTKSRDPDFKQYESQFRQYIRDNGIRPELLNNPTIVETIRKAIGYDHLKTKRKAPGVPPAVDESYAQQGQQARRRAQANQAPQMTREPTDEDREVANFYRMPVEEYLSPDLGSDAEASWDMPENVGFHYTDNPRNRRLS